MTERSVEELEDGDGGPEAVEVEGDGDETQQRTERLMTWRTLVMCREVMELSWERVSEIAVFQSLSMIGD